MNEYSSPSSHLVKSMPKFLYASASTIVDLVIGLWILYSLLGITGLADVFQPVIESRLFPAYIVTAVAGWVLYVTAWSTRIDNMESFSTSSAGEMPEVLKGADSIEEVSYRRLLNDIYLNSAATIYKMVAIVTAAIVGTWASGSLPVIGVLIAVAYAPTDYRAAKIRWWLSPTMIAMAIVVAVLYFVVTTVQLLVPRYATKLPSIPSLIHAIKPTQFSLLGLFRHLFSTVGSADRRG